jgi:predicted secreted hydrolase
MEERVMAGKRVLAGLLLLAALGALYLWWRSVSAAAGGSQASLIPLLSEEADEGYSRALEPGAIEFPRDLGPHNDFQTEWWYYTGNLATTEGRPFGFQLTFFRRALSPAEPVAGESEWRASQLYLAHFTISDIEREQFYVAERFSRGAAGLAGAQAEPYRVWLDNWQAAATARGQVRLFAQEGDARLELALTETTPPILHGDQGLSQKGDEPGNASYYYSMVQQSAVGQITIGAEQFAVTGRAWKDHEYSTSALDPEAVGWDWFSLQLDDGTALMFFQIRRQDGSLEPESSGTFIAADGATTGLGRQDWQLDIGDTWTSPTSGAVYPADWRIRVPALDLELEGEPLMANQELNVSSVYWEGAVAFTGTRQGQPVTARGYIEMTGYAIGPAP